MWYMMTEVVMHVIISDCHCCCFCCCMYHNPQKIKIYKALLFRFFTYVGVRGKYLAIGDRAQSQEFSHGAYFVGKLAWAKGLDLLFDHMQFVKQRYCVA